MEISSFRQCLNGEWIQDPAGRIIAAPSAPTKCSNSYRYLANLNKDDARSLIELSFYIPMDVFLLIL
jgi:hypothetical protein